MKQIPLRMCVACRQMKDKMQLIRIVKNQDEITIDESGKKSGRGAYICKLSECIDKCCKNRLINRNFKCEVSAEFYKKLKEVNIDETFN